jgi:ADP-heptose:LPS heptosyltransferase
MATYRTPHNSRWVIVSVDKPVIMRRSDGEAWPLNPRRRYILNADVLTELEPYIETMSDLEGSALYKPLRSATKANLFGANVLVERYRDRGLGDLLFTTGPLAYISHLTGGAANMHYYTYADRGSILNNSPYIKDGSPLVGPVLYDDLPRYDYHWFIGTMTEFNEEPEHLNVYDALFTSLGIDPAGVDAKFKRPHARLYDSEVSQMVEFFKHLFETTPSKLDLRHSGYYVVAPFTNTATRSASFAMWLRTISALAARRPVLVMGAMRERMPSTDMSAGDFVGILDSDANLVPSGRVVNLLGKTEVRDMMKIISKASAVVSLDSAALYIAQAFRVPCVSLWGTHDPGVRIGYDPDYMQNAIWPQEMCRHSPCYAWQGFPTNRCPNGNSQQVCHCLASITHEAIVKQIEEIESKSPKTLNLRSPL